MREYQVQAVVDAAFETQQLILAVQEWREARLACMKCFDENLMDCAAEVTRLGNAEYALMQASGQPQGLLDAFKRMQRGSPLYCGIRRPRAKS